MHVSGDGVNMCTFSRTFVATYGKPSTFEFVFGQTYIHTYIHTYITTIKQTNKQTGKQTNNQAIKRTTREATT